MIHYTIYGPGPLTISHPNLCALQKATGDFLARAEDSGCEGIYTEVARWSHCRERWERFCFIKFLGGEDHERADWTPRQLAEHHAAEINLSAGPNQSIQPLVHCLPETPGQEAREAVIAACPVAVIAPPAPKVGA